MQQDAPSVRTLDYAPSLRVRAIGWVWAGGFLLTPFIVIFMYALFSRWPARIFTVRSDYAFDGIACASGAFFAAGLHLPFWLRVTLAIAYAALLYLVMDRLSLYAIGIIHDDWL